MIYFVMVYAALLNNIIDNHFIISEIVLLGICLRDYSNSILNK